MKNESHHNNSGRSSCRTYGRRYFKQILPLLNVKKDYKNQIEKELRWFIDTSYHNVPNFIDINKNKIKSFPYYKYLYIGDGNIVTDQEPVSGERIPEGGTIILYLG